VLTQRRIDVSRDRYVVLGVLAVALLIGRWGTFGDWSFFQMAGHELGGPHPLALYRDHPEVQIGPLALVLSWPFTLLGTTGAVLAKAVILALGLVCVRCAELVGRAVRGPVRPDRVLLSGALFLLIWSFVATSGHLDDALAVTGVMLAMVALTRDAALAAGLCLGLATAAKPWAVLALPVLLALPLRRCVRAAGLALATTVAGWLPFVLAAPGTVSAVSSFHVPLTQASVLHLLLGEPAGSAYPGWVRPVQFGFALAGATFVARRGAWWAVPAVAFGLRVLLDPGWSTYYAAGLGAGAVTLDLTLALAAPAFILSTFAGTALTTWVELWLIRIDRPQDALRLLADAAYPRLLCTAALVVAAAAFAPRKPVGSAH
jgi:hypothetical protein